MRKIILAALSAFACFNCVSAQAATLLAESEDFLAPGMWTRGVRDGQGFISTESTGIASTVVKIPEDGIYYVWASSFDFEKVNPGIRSYKVLIDGAPLPKPAAKHGKDGWKWELLGSVQIKKGNVAISLEGVGTFPRSDALILTADSAYDPNVLCKTSDDRRKIKTANINLKIENKYLSEFSKLTPLKNVTNAQTVSVGNAILRLKFTQKEGAGGALYFERYAEAFDGAKWVKLPDFKDEYFFLNFSKSDPKYNGARYFSAWAKTYGGVTTIVDGKEIKSGSPSLYPYAAEKTQILRVKNVRKLSPTSVALECEGGLKAVLTLLKDAPAIKADVSYTASADGYYSIGFLNGAIAKPEEVTAVQLPTMFQMRNLMSAPKQVGDNMTSHPLALFEQSLGGVPYVNAVIADPKKFAKDEWAKKQNSQYGFSLAAPDGFVQTAIFYPILGGKNSLKKEGDEIKFAFYILNALTDWKGGLEIANTKVFTGGKIFRQAYETSFSDALGNIARFLKDEKYSAWDRTMKGRWNIEDKDLVTQASPLSEVSVAILTDDEDYYKNIALPTIEYTLSRAGSHFSKRNEKSPYSATPYAFSVPSSMWGIDYYLGLNKLIGGGNNWVDDFEKMNLKPTMFYRRPYWALLLGSYIAKPDAAVLEEAKAECDKWIKKAFHPASTAEADYEDFINVGSYPYWWYLTDMYEITGEAKYLKYAEAGAFNSLASLWNFPIPEGEQTINKGNMVYGVGCVWWLGDEKFRLGWDTREAANALSNGKLPIKGNATAFPQPEKQADSLKVSRLGLSIEQHSTYICGDEYMWNICMPSMAPEMLKVAQYTHRDILKKFSRHAIIGRYSNFLGYYVSDFTDLLQDSLYPYKGPDISSLYYHHAPCHFAQTLDYLMAQLEAASANKIKFPYVRQQGYVWFVDRIFGLPGNVYGDANCKPVLDMDAVRPDSPKVSTFMARSENFIYAFIFNDSDAAINVKVTLDSTSRGMKGAKLEEQASVLNADGKETGKAQILGANSFEISAQGLITLKIPAEKQAIVSSLPRMEGNTHIEVKNAAQKGGADFGDFHAFRIRGPFGKDSIYAFFTKGVDKNATLYLDLEEPFKQHFEKAKFPYEISVYPLNMQSKIKFKARIAEDGKAPIDLGEFEL